MYRSRRAEDVAHEVEGPRLAGQEAPGRSLRTLDASDAGRPSGTGRTLRSLRALDADDARAAALPRLALQALLTAEALLARRSDHAALTLGAGEPRLALAPALAPLALLTDRASRASFAGNALFTRDAPLARRTLGALVTPVTGEAGTALRTRLALFAGQTGGANHALVAGLARRAGEPDRALVAGFAAGAGRTLRALVTTLADGANRASGPCVPLGTGPSRRTDGPLRADVTSLARQGECGVDHHRGLDHIDFDDLDDGVCPRVRATRSSGAARSTFRVLRLSHVPVLLLGRSNDPARRQPFGGHGDRRTGLPAAPWPCSVIVGRTTTLPQPA